MHHICRKSLLVVFRRCRSVVIVSERMNAEQFYNERIACVSSLGSGYLHKELLNGNSLIFVIFSLFFVVFASWCAIFFCSLSSTIVVCILVANAFIFGWSAFVHEISGCGKYLAYRNRARHGYYLINMNFYDQFVHNKQRAVVVFSMLLLHYDTHICCAKYAKKDVKERERQPTQSNRRPKFQKYHRENYV